MSTSSPTNSALPSEVDAAGATAISLAILAALENWDVDALARAVESDPSDPIHSHVSVKGLQGTPHYRALDYAILMSNSGANFEHAVLPAVACARVLLANRAPVPFLSLAPTAAAMVFLDTDWSNSSMASVLQQLLREYIEAGVVLPNEPLPPNNSVGGLLPLVAAAKLGNLPAAAALLEYDVDMSAALNATGFDDILALIRSYDRPHLGAIAALVAEKLMRAELRHRPPPGEEESLRPQQRRRSRAL